MNAADGGAPVSNTYSYNKRRLLTGETIQRGGSTASTISYAYNANGHLSSVTYPAPGPVLDYAPNALGQPTQAGAFASAVSYFPNGMVKRFTYGNGIVHTQTQNTRSLPARRMDCTNSGATCAETNRRLDLHYSYDSHGNTFGITDHSPGGRHTRQMSYDNLDRLLYVTSPVTVFGIASYTYDVLDNLTSVKLSGGSHARDHSYQHTDTLGTPLVVTDNNKAVVETSTYEPYGQLINRTPFDGLGYTGHVQDAATGLTYMQQRYYDPLLGIFLSVDPVTAYTSPISQFHRYRYANNNPYGFVDRDGAQSRAMAIEIGRWIKALRDNDGDFEKAKEQIKINHENDMKKMEFIIDFTRLGLAKDVVQISIKIANNEDASGQSAGVVVGEISSLAAEKILDGKIGGDAASVVGASVGKIAGNSIEATIDHSHENNSDSTKTDYENDEMNSRIPNESK